MIESILIKKLFDEVYTGLKSYLRKHKSILVIKQTDFEEILKRHILYIVNWCSEISFLDAVQKKETIKTYVNLDYFLTPKRSHFSSKEREKTIRLEQIIEKENHNILILGDPGAGKTTTLKYIAYKILNDETFFQTKFKFPILVRLKELKENETLIEKLANTLGIYIRIPDSEFQINKYEILLSAITNTIKELQCLVLLDGFDEIQTQNLKKEILTDIENLSVNSEITSFILTCRSADFYYNISNVSIYEIKPLEDNQIKIFVQNWLKDLKKSRKLLRIINSSTYKYYALKPLTLAHLCAIFERTGSIPEKPVFLYKKYTELLLSEWDNQNRIKRISMFSEFDNETKLNFLSHIAYLSKIKYGFDYFEKDKLQNIYKEICGLYNLPSKEAIRVVNEIESHTGLFLQTGYNSFEFEHKTIQEYITSEYLVRNFSKIEINSTYKLPNELAAALLLTDDPNNYFINILTKIDFFNSYNRFFDDKRIERYLYTIQKHVTLNRGQKNFMDNKLLIDDLPISTYQYDFFNTFIARISIEKPDFKSSPRLIYWMLGIYTIGSLFKEDNAQLELFSLNTNLYLENLFNESFFLESLNMIDDFYKIGISKTNEYAREIKIKDRPFLPFILKKYTKTEFDLPKFIYIPLKTTENKLFKAWVDNYEIKFSKSKSKVEKDD